MKEVKCYKFWEQNLNPITMMKDEKKIHPIKPIGEGKQQEFDERATKVRLSNNVRSRIKKVSKFW